MGRVKYSIESDKDTSSRSMGYELHISPKHAREISNAIKGMGTSEARKYLEEVIALKRAIPFKRYNRNVGHRRGLKKWDAGRYPQKAASFFLKILTNAESNAEYKGLDPENMRITHVATKKGRVIRGIMPRAMGRATAKNTETVTIEMILESRG
ncbi:MAG TPA: 50S ribosomal protein L22 [Methanosarcinales archaeon]|nr:50S ribosomal protein L22 [Methanosarcinales archaeon]